MAGMGCDNQAGQSMLARRLTTILPAMTLVEAIRQYQGLWCTIFPREHIAGGRCLCQATRKSLSVLGVYDQ